MGKACDLRNQRFGRLTALYPTDGRDSTGSILWECQCDCGNKTVVSSRNLKSNASLSCGCLKKEMTAQLQAKDLAGQQFGKLLVIRKTDLRKQNSIVWECQCACGNTALVCAKSLCSGQTKSCGCHNLEVAKTRAKQRADADIVAHTRLSFLNSTIFSNNSSGVRGVTLHKAAGKWAASIGFQKHVYYLGLFENKEDAIRARKIAEETLWRPFIEQFLGSYDTEEERVEKLHKFLTEKITASLAEEGCEP